MLPPGPRAWGFFFGHALLPMGQKKEPRPMVETLFFEEREFKRSFILFAVSLIAVIIVVRGLFDLLDDVEG